MSEALRILKGDCRETLKTLPSESVHCVVTSPPYHGLRRYLDDDHQDKAAEIGLEPSVDAHIQALVEVFREVKRVCRKDSVICVNYGDAYSTSANGRKAADIVDDDRTFRDKPFSTTGELPAKNLLMLPFRLAIALQQDGWVLRSILPWVKRAAMPCSAKDRPSNAIEYVFLFAKQARYYWDQESVRRPHSTIDTDKRLRPERYYESIGRSYHAHEEDQVQGQSQKKIQRAHPNGRNMRNSDFYFDSLDLVIQQAKAELAHLEHLRERGGLLLSGEEPLALDVNPQASKVAHYASYPEALVTPLIQAGTSEWGCCQECGAPWKRVVETEFVQLANRRADRKGSQNERRGSGSRDVNSKEAMGYNQTRTTGWQPTCNHEAPVIPCTVLDPFAGTGTTMLVANRLGRRAIGCELSEDYIEISNRKNSQQTMLFTEVG